MEQTNTDELAAELAGLMLHALLAGVPLDCLERHFRAASDPALPAGSPGYAALLRVAIGDLRDAAVERGYPEEVVRKWAPVPVWVVLAIGEGLLEGKFGQLSE
jgi:hypothetical protein